MLPWKACVLRFSTALTILCGSPTLSSTCYLSSLLHCWFSYGGEVFFLDLNGEIKKYNPKTEYFKTNRRQLISLWGWSLCLCIIGKMWRGSPTDLFHSSVFLPGPAGICIQVPFFSAEKCSRTSLVVRGIRICLPMQGLWVQSLVWEIP